MPVYRDARDALRHRADALRDEAARREAGVTAAFWRCIPDDDARALREARDEARRADDPARACEALARYLARFDAVWAELARHEAAWRRVPEGAALDGDLATPAGREDSPAHPATRDFDDAVRALDPGARVQAWRRAQGEAAVHTAVASVRVESQPVALRAEVAAVQEDVFVVRALRASTTVPMGLPALLARPETWTESLFRGLRRVAGRGDDRFGSFFHVECVAGEGEGVLTPEVREALLVVAAVDVPTLRVSAPEASLTWRFAPTRPTVAAAARCMAALRRAPTLPLRR